jgi:hypothetical protein
MWNSARTVDLPADLAKALGIDDALFRRPPNVPRASGNAVPFTPLSEVEKAVDAAISGIDFEGMARRAAEGRGRRCNAWISYRAGWGNSEPRVARVLARSSASVR